MVPKEQYTENKINLSDLRQGVKNGLWYTAQNDHVSVFVFEKCCPLPVIRNNNVIKDAGSFK